MCVNKGMQQSPGSRQAAVHADGKQPPRGAARSSRRGDARGGHLCGTLKSSWFPARQTPVQ